MLNIKILFICKASIKEGLGHFIRTVTLTDYIDSYQPELNIELLLISSINRKQDLKSKKYKTTILDNEKKLELDKNYDTIVLDMLTISETNINYLKSKCKRLISISPIFDKMSSCDMLISRTKYINLNLPASVTLKCGLEYSIIRTDCEKIKTSSYVSNLKREYTSVAISMGGTDPQNLTLKYLSELSKTTKKVIFWVLLGEGYEHNYKSLSDIIRKRGRHEIILARTNRNMWHLLSNCSIAILKGGLTSYEAVYAGLPAINVFEDKNRSYLVKELCENELCLSTAQSVDNILKQFNNDLVKDNLLKIHKKTKSFLRKPPIINVINAILSVH